MTGRFEIGSKLRGESPVRRGLMRETAKVQQIRIMPDLNVIKIGGHGVIDYGKKVIYPLIEEIGELTRDHKILVATGGGARTRHIPDLGIDLGMPTGVLAERDQDIVPLLDAQQHPDRDRRPLRPPVAHIARNVAGFASRLGPRSGTISATSDL